MEAQSDWYKVPGVIHDKHDKTTRSPPVSLLSDSDAWPEIGFNFPLTECLAPAGADTVGQIGHRGHILSSLHCQPLKYLIFLIAGPAGYICNLSRLKTKLGYIKLIVHFIIITQAYRSFSLIPWTSKRKQDPFQIMD